MSTRDHVVLVPGFGGFDTLGPLRYYSGVAEALRSGPGKALTVYHFNDLPTASVDVRARTLRAWLWERVAQGHLQPGARGAGDGIHLVGHSTGGLDLRAFLRDLLDACEAGDAVARLLRDGLRSVQFLSTPHRGTNLAAAAWGLRNLAPLLVARPLYELNALFHPGGAHLVAHATRWLLTALGWPPKGVLRAVVDTGAAFDGGDDPVTRARARAAWFAVLQWLHHIAVDTNAVADLRPDPESDAARPRSGPLVRRVLREPARQLSLPGLESVSGRHEVADALLDARVWLRSIVTVAPPRPGTRPDLYRFLHGYTARKPVPPLDALHWKLPRLGEATPSVSIAPEDNDGIVNSVSMVWPDAERSVVVEADHGDIIGHFEDPPAGEPIGPGRDARYDLLPSGAGFDRARFLAVWESVRDFALDASA